MRFLLTQKNKLTAGHTAGVGQWRIHTNVGLLIAPHACRPTVTAPNFCAATKGGGEGGRERKGEREIEREREGGRERERGQENVGDR